MATKGNSTSRTTIATQIVTVVAVVLAFWAATNKLSDLQGDLKTATTNQQVLNAKISHLESRVTRLQHIKTEIIAAIRQVVKDHLKQRASFGLGATQATLVSVRRPRYCWGKRIKKFGTASGDLIFGTPGPDVIWSGPGDDAVFGDGGNDRICGGSGDDTLVGDPGTDRVTGGPGNDECVAEHTRKCER